MTSVPLLYLCCHTLPELDVPVAFGIARFVKSMEACRSRALHVATVRNGGSFSTAAIVAPGADWIVHRPSTSPVRDTQVIVHQAAHLLLGHQGIALSGSTLGDLLFPGLVTRCGLPADEVDCGVGTADEERAAVVLTRDLLRCGEATMPRRSAA